MDITKKIEELLVEKKYDEVRKIITDAGKEKMTGEQTGETLVGLAETYIDVSNSINERYLAALEEAVAGMKMLNTAEAETLKKIKLAEVRGKLNG